MKQCIVVGAVAFLVVETSHSSAVKGLQAAKLSHS